MKESKDAARYTPHAMIVDQRCGLCAHFIAGGECQKVEGRISPQGWCRFFKRHREVR